MFKRVVKPFELFEIYKFYVTCPILFSVLFVSNKSEQERKRNCYVSYWRNDCRIVSLNIVKIMIEVVRILLPAR